MSFSRFETSLKDYIAELLNCLPEKSGFCFLFGLLEGAAFLQSERKRSIALNYF